MPNRRDIAAMAGIGALAAVAGWALSPWRTGSGSDASALRSARFADLSGKPRSLVEWSGQVLAVNFWATWCPPCREEIPALVVTRDKMTSSGVEFIGIAIDHALKVAEFVRSIRISYPVLLGDPSAMALVRDLGNPTGGLPFTVVLDQLGRVTHRNLGAVTQQTIEGQLKDALRTGA